jgi:hypothetical protein
LNPCETNHQNAAGYGPKSNPAASERCKLSRLSRKRSSQTATRRGEAARAHVPYVYRHGRAEPSNVIRRGVGFGSFLTLLMRLLNPLQLFVLQKGIRQTQVVDRP